ncbi:adenylyl-sulfate kinase [Thioalkalivibrio denitrificans]|uniref:Adenylyl-sulfate kinase n=2 Tax=Thioalkalivibrio denitrificans TaxID=108003 RepID=A0A1V3NIH0_9GAMM|nr:adenylyl-sulfate kinase [Thioalkalivibrio denitrificans]
MGSGAQGNESVFAVSLDRYLRDNQHLGLLRMTVCDPVDEGVHTLIGRRLVDSDPAGSIAGHGPSGCGTLAPAPVLVHVRSGPGSQATSRSFLAQPASTDPGALCSLIIDASDNDVALLLVSARSGVTTEVRRHVCLISHAGFRHVIVVVTDTEQMPDPREAFDRVTEAVRSFADRVEIDKLTALPAALSSGENIVSAAAAMPWYQGPTLTDCLTAIEPEVSRQRNAHFRLMVLQVEERGGHQACSGLVASGTVRPGDRVRIQPMGRESRVTGISAASKKLDEAVAGQSVTLTVENAAGIGPGAVISTINAPAEVADQFEARIIWLHEQPLYPGRKYLMRIGASTVDAVVTDIKYEINVDNLDHLAANKLELSGIGVCNLALDRPVPFAPYGDNRDLGGFLLIDRLSGDTMGVGMLNFALRRAHNIHLQHVDIDKQARVAQKGHRPCVLWFTGLSGSGKSTVANLVERRLHALGAHTYLLDGDNVRHGLNRDLGFTDADRVENIRRVAEVSKLMVDAGLVVITAFISPFRAERRMARQLLLEGEFFEIFTDTPLEVAEQRDPKGLYKKARRGDLKNFTGIDSPYERPEAPEIRLDTGALDPESAADRVIRHLMENGILAVEDRVARSR